MKMNALSVLLLAGMVAGCAARRVEQQKEQQELSDAASRVRSCIIAFVLKTDSPRLTGTELAEAGAAACSSDEQKLRQLAVDQDAMSAPAIDAMVQNVIRDGERDALAALAVRDSAPQRTPAKSVSPLPQT